MYFIVLLTILLITATVKQSLHELNGRMLGMKIFKEET
jgi:hypothetical protein